MEKKKIIISLGGSLLWKENEINLNFLKKFRNLILKHLKKYKFVIFVGGGKIARKYQEALKEFGAESFERDQIGIEVTRLNAKVVKRIFSSFCNNTIITDPTKKVNFKKDIIVGSGFKPGFSTDYVSVLFAKHNRIKEIINLTNIDFIYDKDPRKFKNVKPLKEISFKEYKRIIGGKWEPGLSTPFDPIASKLAEKLSINVFIINGEFLKRLDCVLNKKIFIGTLIYGSSKTNFKRKN